MVANNTDPNRPLIKPRVSIVSNPQNSQIGVKKTLTKSERKMLYDKSKWRCAYCGCILIGDTNFYGHENACPSMLDLNGGYEEKNAVAACQLCQSVKQTLSVSEMRKVMFGRGAEDKYIAGKLSANILKKVPKLSLEHYNFLMQYGDQFYYELPDYSKSKVDALWNNVEVHNLKGEVKKLETIADRSIVDRSVVDHSVNGEAPTRIKELFKEPENSTNFYDPYPPVQEEPARDESVGFEEQALNFITTLAREYKELKAKRDVLMRQVNEIDTKIKKYQQAYDAMKAFEL